MKISFSHQLLEMLVFNTRTVVGEISHPQQHQENDFELVGLKSEDWAAVAQAVPHFLSDLLLVKKAWQGSCTVQRTSHFFSIFSNGPYTSSALVPKQEASSVQTVIRSL